MKDVCKYGQKIEEVPFNLKISFDEPLRLSFVRAETGGHIFGYVTIWDGELVDPEIIFGNVGPESLIPSVSSFSFDKGMSGAELDFFLINDGFNLNHNNKNFNDIVAGQGGRLSFIERVDEWQNILGKDDNGNLQWLNKQTGESVSAAKVATVKSFNPLLVWIPDDDSEIQIINGHIFHTFARMGSEFTSLNPDGFCHAKVFFDVAEDSLSIGFCEILDPDSGLYNDIKFRFAIGEDNVQTLIPEMINIGSALDDVEEDFITSALLKITDNFVKGDVLRPWAIYVEEDGSVDGAGVTLTNMDADGSLVLNGKAAKAVYEILFKHIRICNLNGISLNKTRGLMLKITTDGGVYNLAIDAIAGHSGERGQTAVKDTLDTLLKDTVKQTKTIIDTAKNPEMDKLQRTQEAATEIPDHESVPECEDETTIREALKKELETALQDELAEDACKTEIAESDLNNGGNDDRQKKVSDDKNGNLRPSPLATSERKTVLITGAAKRVGKELALCFAKDGWNVIIHCNTSLEEARTLAREVAKHKVRTAVLQADLTDEAEIVQIFSQIFNVFKKVDLLINNASFLNDDDIFSATEESWEKHMMINTRAPLLLTKDFAMQFVGKNNGFGNVINITDAGAMRAKKGFFSYSVSKAAMTVMTRMMAFELAPSVRVNAIAPWQIMPSKYDSAKSFEKKVESSPLGIKNSAYEIYSAIKFILDAHSMTGQTISIDSGAFL